MFAHTNSERRNLKNDKITLEFLTEKTQQEIYISKANLQRGKDMDNDTLVIESLLALSNTYYEVHQYETSLEYAFQALQKSKDKLVKSEADSWFCIGITYLKIESANKAISALKRAITLYQTIGQEEKMAFCMGNIAIAYGIKKEYDKTIGQLKILSDIYTKRQDSANLCYAIYNMAYAHQLQRNFTQAKALSDSLQNCFQKYAYPYLPHIYILNGIIAYETNESAQAIHEFKRANESAIQIPNLDIQATALWHLGKITEKQRDFSQSSEYYKKLLGIRDSLNTQKYNKKIYELELAFQSEQKDKDIYLLKKEKKLTEQRVVIISSIFLLTCSIFIFLIVYWRQKSKYTTEKYALLNQELQYKQSVVSTFIIQKSELESILKEIKNTSAKINQEVITTPTLQSKIKDLNDSLHKTTSISNSWETIFDDKSCDFIYKLNTLYPELTPMEKKVCNLLYADFSTKAIANLFNITEKSVNNTRSKIRKKMNIPESISIGDQLRQL